MAKCNITNGKVLQSTHIRTTGPKALAAMYINYVGIKTGIFISGTEQVIK